MCVVLMLTATRCCSITGTNGVLKPPRGYLEGVRALCDEFGILMVCDEGAVFANMLLKLKHSLAYCLSACANSDGWLWSLRKAVWLLPRAVCRA
jgi:hypothetical protein